MMFRLSQVFMLCLLHSLVCATTQTVEDIRKRCFEQRVDLVFVVDASYSVQAPNFERAKSFINKIVSGLPIGPTAVRVALVRFDKTVTIINHFLDNLQDVTDSVWNMTYPDDAGTNIGGALKEVREQVFDVRKEDGVKDIVITITNGESDEVDVTEEQASLLRDQGAQLVWLYIYKGWGPLEDEKNFMEEQGDLVIVVDHFNKLTDDIVLKMLVASCPDQTTPSTTTSTVLTTDIQTTNPSTPVASTEDDSTTTASVDFLVSTPEQSVTVTEQPSITTESPVVSSSSFASAIAESPTADIWFPDAEMTSEANLITSPTEKFDLPVTHVAADLPVLTLSTILRGQRTTAVRDVTHTATEQTKESSTKEKDDDSALNHMRGTPPWSPAALRMTTYPANTPRLAQAWCCNGLPWYQYWLFIGTTIGSSSEVIGGPPLAQDWLSLGRILAPMSPPFYPNIRPVYLIGQSCAKHALPKETPHSTTIAPLMFLAFGPY